MTDIVEPLAVLESAKRAGVSALLCCGYNRCANEAVLALRERAPGLTIALGIHPWHAGEGVDGFSDLVLRTQPNAIGEIGLDGKQDVGLPELTVQERVFVAQLEIAERLQRPVTVHSRQAVDRVVAIAREFSRVRGVLHAYAGSFEQIAYLVERGWMVGVGGAATRPRASKIRRMVSRIPREALLLETDSPAIGLEGVRPPDVRPHHLPEVARAVAELRGCTVERIVVDTDENARRMFASG